MDKEIAILLIEDSPADIRFAEIQLNNILGSKHSLVVRDYISKALQLLHEKKIDIIILDLSLPDSKGLGSLQKILDAYSIPVVIYTGVDDGFIKAEALRMGASDYLIKGSTSDDTLYTSILTCMKQEPLVFRDTVAS